MSRVVAIILHAVPESSAGPLERAFADDRRRNADRQARGFATLGATVEIIETQRRGPPFGERLRGLTRDLGLARSGDAAGLVVMGSGSIPLARRADRALFMAAAAGPMGSQSTGRSRGLLTNNVYSGDILAIPACTDLEGLPDLAADNGVPRWAADHGLEVHDLRDRWRLQVDLDSPLDVVLATLNDGGRRDGDGDGRDTTDARSPGRHVRSVLERIRAVAEDPASEFLVAGRTSSTTLRWVERNTASRTRVLIEERGMKTAPAAQRPSRSALGLLLDADGPDALGAVVEQLADAAVVDTRVLMAHHFGRAEAAWPAAEDRFASDLLLPDQINDPWLRALTASAAGSGVPILLGGHTLVGPGLRLALRPGRTNP
ncbi:MAG: hypothetical protein ABI573_05620 [Chloroflexota bacterium]